MTQEEAIAVARQIHGDEILVVRKPIEGTASRKWVSHPSFLGELFVPGGGAFWWVFRYRQDISTKSFSHLQKTL